MSGDFASAVRATIMLLGAQTAARVINIAYIVLLARWLPVEAFGYFSLAIAVLTIADTLTDFGVSRLASRQIAQDPSVAAAELGLLVPFKLVTGLAVYLLLNATTLLFGFSRDFAAIFAIGGLALLLTGPAMVMEGALQGLQRFKVVGLAHFSLSVVQLAAGLVLLSVGLAGAGAAIALVVGNSAMAIVMVFGLRRADIAFAPRIALDALSERLKSAGAYGVTTVVFVISMRLELLALGWMGTAAALGVFSMVYRLLEVGLMVAVAFSMVLAPRFAALHVQSAERLSGLYLQALRYASLAAVCASLIGIAIASPVLEHLFSLTDGRVAKVLRIVLLGYPCAVIYYLNIAFMLAAQDQTATLRLVVGTSVAQLCIALVLIGAFDAEGAATTLVVAAALGCLVSTLHILRSLREPDSTWRALLPVVLSAPMLPVLLSVGGASPWLLLPIAILTCALSGLAAWLLPLRQL